MGMTPNPKQLHEKHHRSFSVKEGVFTVGAQNSQAIEVFRILRPWKIHNNPRGLPQTPPNKQSWNTTNTQTNASCFFGQNSHQKNMPYIGINFFHSFPKTNTSHFMIHVITHHRWSFFINHPVPYYKWKKSKISKAFSEAAAKSSLLATKIPDSPFPNGLSQHFFTFAFQTLRHTCRVLFRPP